MCSDTLSDRFGERVQVLKNRGRLLGLTGNDALELKKARRCCDRSHHSTSWALYPPPRGRWQ